MNQHLGSRKNVGLYFALIVAAIYLSSVFVLPISASAYSASPAVSTAPKLILRPFTTSPGKSVKVTGLHFTPSSTVTITFNGADVASGVATNTSGGFVTNFAVPIGTKAGSYPVVAIDALSFQASNTLVVAAKSKITLSTEGNPRIVGSPLTIVGSGFIPNNPLTVLFGGTVVASLSTNSTGGFTTSFPIPKVSAGSYTVSANDGTNTASKSFTVNPHLTSSPTSVAPGGMITVAGTGFAANSNVAFTLNGAALSATATTDSSGSFSLQITIPINASPVGQALKATDQSGDSASVRIQVT
jgi:large repetitive protein